MTVGVIGTGRMGTALVAALSRSGVPALQASGRGGAPVPRLVAGCRTISLDTLLRRATLVIIALPFPVALDLVAANAERHGRDSILVDVTNPALSRVRLPPGRSGGELMAEAGRGWRTVKSFNTVAACLLDLCPRHSGTASVPVATDDPAAKAEVFTLARRLGFEPLDAGGIGASGELESLAVLLSRISDAHGLHGRIGISIEQPPADPVRVTADTGAWRS